MIAQRTQVASLVAQCADPDGMAVLAYLSRHMRRAERLGLRIRIVSEKQLERDARILGAVPPVPPSVGGSTVIYRTNKKRHGGPTVRQPWCHVSCEAVESAMRRPCELRDLLDWLEDFMVDGHYARTGRWLRIKDH
jgi:hypothetical protein